MPPRKDTFVLTADTKRQLRKLAHHNEQNMSAFLRSLIQHSYERTFLTYDPPLARGHTLVDTPEAYVVEGGE